MEAATLRLSSLAALESLSGLEQLREVGTLYLYDLQTLGSLAGLEQLRQVHDTLHIENLTELVDMTALAGLTEIGNALTIYGSSSLASLDGLHNLTRVGGVVTIGGNAQLENLDALAGVEDMGSLQVRSNPRFTSLSGLARLAPLGSQGSLGEGLFVDSNGALTELGLNALERVDGGIDIWDNAVLRSLAGLETLTSVGGELTVRMAGALTSLDGIENLASVGAVSIFDCPKLVSLRALASLESVRTSCSLFRNETLPTCEAEWLQQLVEAIGGQFSASDTDDNGVCL